MNNTPIIPYSDLEWFWLRVPNLVMAEADDHERRSWNVEKEGSLPLFVLEVVTEDSWNQDTEHKPILYDRMGVREYMIFAPEREGPGPRLFGYHGNVAGSWVTWEAEENGELRSDVFGGLHFFVDGSRLRVRDVDGRVLLSDEEAAEQETARADAAEAELRLLKARYGISER